MSVFSPPHNENHVDWRRIDTVMLDMDGTLLDKHFDDYFWEQYVPEHFALEHDLEIEEARQRLKERYDKQSGTLAWTDLDFWSSELGLDIPLLKMKVESLIAVHPYVLDFLSFCRRSGKMVLLVTNAHIKTLSIKMQKTAIDAHFDHIICSQDIGMPKEYPKFWEGLHDVIPFDKARTLLADDTLAVLKSARHFGMKWLVLVARPSSRSPAVAHEEFMSIHYFNELLPGQENDHKKGG